MRASPLPAKPEPRSWAKASHTRGSAASLRTMAALVIASLLECWSSTVAMAARWPHPSPKNSWKPPPTWASSPVSHRIPARHHLKGKNHEPLRSDRKTGQDNFRSAFRRHDRANGSPGAGGNSPCRAGTDPQKGPARGGEDRGPLQPGPHLREGRQRRRIDFLAERFPERLLRAGNSPQPGALELPVSRRPGGGVPRNRRTSRGGRMAPRRNRNAVP